MSEQEIRSDNAPDPVGAYPHARRAGEFLFLSGVGPRQPGTDEIPGGPICDSAGGALDYDVVAQTEAVVANVRTILEAAGSSLDKVVDVTVFLTDMRGDFDIYNRIYRDYFKDNQPCRTTVEVTSLPTPIAIELKCIATID